MLKDSLLREQKPAQAHTSRSRTQRRPIDRNARTRQETLRWHDRTAGERDNVTLDKARAAKDAAYEDYSTTYDASVKAQYTDFLDIARDVALCEIAAPKIYAAARERSLAGLVVDPAEEPEIAAAMADVERGSLAAKHAREMGEAAEAADLRYLARRAAYLAVRRAPPPALSLRAAPRRLPSRTHRRAPRRAVRLAAVASAGDGPPPSEPPAPSRPREHAAAHGGAT